MSRLSGKSWTDPPPPFPFRTSGIPDCASVEEAQTLAKQIIDRGKEVFSKKCYLDALWKYDNAYQLCCVKCVSSNIKGRALLGCATASFELLKQSSSYERNLFGQYTDSCLSECIGSAFPLKFQSKACYTRAQIWKYHMCLEPMDKKYYELDDYIQCFKLAFPRQLHLAAEALKQSIVLAVNIKCLERLPTAKELSKQFCSQASLLVKLLEKLGNSDDTEMKHIEFVLIKSGMTENCKCELPDNVFCRLISKAPCNDIIEVLFKLCPPNEEFVVQLAVGSQQMTEQLLLIQYIIKDSMWSDSVIHSICSECNPSQRTQLVVWSIENHQTPSRTMTILRSGEILPQEIDLSKVVEEPSDPTLIKQLLDHNIDPNGNASSKKTPLFIVANKVYRPTKRSKQFLKLDEIICLLLEAGADIEDLCSLEQGKRKSSLHMATELALCASNIQILKIVAQKATIPDDGKLLNYNNETPLHLVLKKPISDVTREACIILVQAGINTECEDINHKKAADYCQSDDKRLELLRMPASLKPKQHSQHHTDTVISSMKMEIGNDAKPPMSKEPQAQMKIEELLEKQVNEVLGFDPEAQSPTGSMPDFEPMNFPDDIDTVPMDDIEDNSYKPFDAPKWEVEMTSKAQNALESPNFSLRKKVAEKIHCLASGEKNTDLVKKVGDNLYECRVNISVRILWQFSKQECQDRPESYTDIIRILDIVHHKNLQQRIEYYKKSNAVKCVEKYLVVLEDEETDGYNYPRLYKKADQITKYSYKPPITAPDGDNFQFDHLYPVDKSYMDWLSSDSLKYDVPFKLFSEERKIICRKPTSTILLTGRSGTGKTTCCMFRLWHIFQTVWGTWLSEQKTALCKTSSSELVGCLSTTNPDLQQPLPLPKCRHVFVTKNPHLCEQVKEQFHSFARTAVPEYCSELHLVSMQHPLPNCCQDMSPFNYPLFLTATQLQILIYNSLFPPESKNALFPRMEDGSLKVRVLNPEKQDEYMLLPRRDNLKNLHKLEEMYRIEVTSTYFKNYIWPKLKSEISPDSPLQKIDPLLIWTEIISFIKGSQEALETENGWLSERQYEMDIGGKRAPVFRDCRAEVYKLFEKYCKYMNERKPVLFDQADLVHCISKQLCRTEHPIHLFDNIYIDEVQDFTLAELSLYLKLCNSTKGNFFTGDTAQSIIRGVSFRFTDLEVYLRSQGLTCSLDHLTENYRSTYEILQLASSVIHVLKLLFPDSFDSKLPRDEGQIYGTKPMFHQLESPDVNRLASLVEGRSETSNSGVIINFGAEQAIIVCNEETKAEFRKNKSYSDALVLTVVEAKGLEFKDVILYNFFADSQAKPSDWRIVYLLLKEKKVDHIHEKHLALSFELKYLYTAITRAKCNLWICESNKEKSDPMVTLWHERDLIERLELNTAFPKQSTPEQWLKQGNLLRAAQLWDNAAVCFRKANRLDLSEEMHAQQLLQQIAENSSKDQQRQLYLQAASAFLSSFLIWRNQEQFDVKVKNAAECLAKGRKHQLAAMLYKRLQITEEAIKDFEKAGDVKSCISLMEEKSDHDGAIQLCIRMNKPDEALCLADRYGMGRTKTAYRCAEYYSERKNHKSLKMIVDKVPQKDRPRYFKRAELYIDASESYVQCKKYQQAFRLIAAQGLYNQGIKLAKRIKDKKQEQLCILQKARFLMYTGGKIEHKQLQEMDDEFPELRAEAHLILCMSDYSQWHASCKAAIELYNQCELLVGEIEAFHILSKNWKRDDFKLSDVLGTLRVVYDYCEKAKSIEDEVKRADTGPLVKQCERFYCLETHPDPEDQSNCYYLPNEQDIYVGTLKRCQQARDEDGMLMLGRNEVLKEISKHFRQYINDFIEFHSVHHVLTQHTPYYNELNKKHIPRESSLSDCANKLSRCVEMCVLCHEFTKFQPILKPDLIPTSQEFCSIIIFLFSAEVSICLPINESHVCIITSSRWACNALCKWGNKLIEDLTDPEKQHVNKWMEVWLSFSLSRQSRSGLEEVLRNRASQITDTSSKKSKYPYYYRKQEKDFVHYMTFWITACEKLKKKQILPAAYLVFKCFLAKVSRSPSLHRFESIATIVNIGSIFSTALLGVIASYSALQGDETRSNVVVPLIYQHIIEVFELLASDIGNTEVGWVLGASVLRSHNKSKQQELVRDSINTLNYFLCLLLGMLPNSQLMSILELATSSEPSENCFAGRHCLALVLTLICNLILNSKQHTSVTSQALIKLCQILGSDQVKFHGFFQKTYETISSAEDVQTFFHVIADLVGGFSDEHHTKSAFVEIHFESGKLVFRELKHDHIPCLQITSLTMLDQQIQSPKHDPTDVTSRYPVSQKHHPDVISTERSATSPPKSPPKSPSKSFSSDQRNIDYSTKLHVDSAAAFPVQTHTSESSVTKLAQTIGMTQAETSMHPKVHAQVAAVSKRSSSEPGNIASNADNVHTAPTYLTSNDNVHTKPPTFVAAASNLAAQHLQPKQQLKVETKRSLSESANTASHSDVDVHTAPPYSTANDNAHTQPPSFAAAVSNHNNLAMQHLQPKQHLQTARKVKVETKKSLSESRSSVGHSDVDGMHGAPANSAAIGPTQPQSSSREKPSTEHLPTVIATSKSNGKAEGTKQGNQNASKYQLSPTEHTQPTTSPPNLANKSPELPPLKSTENDPKSCSSATLSSKVKQHVSTPSASSAEANTSDNSTTKVTQTTAQAETESPMHPKAHTWVEAVSNHNNLATHSAQPTKRMKVDTKRSFSEPGNTAGHSDVDGMQIAPAYNTSNGHAQPKRFSFQERPSTGPPTTMTTSESNGKVKGKKLDNQNASKYQLSPNESLNHTQTTTNEAKLTEKSLEQAHFKSTENDPQSCSSTTLGIKVRKNDSGNSIPSTSSAETYTSENSATQITQKTAQAEPKILMHPKVHTQVEAASNHNNLATQNLHSAQPTKQVKVETKRSFSEPGNTADHSDVDGKHNTPTSNTHTQPQSVSIQERLSAEHLPAVIATSESNSTLKSANKSPEHALLTSTEKDPLSLQTSTLSTEMKQNGFGNTNNLTRNQKQSEETLSLPAQNVVKEDEGAECKGVQLGVNSAETMPMHSETFTSGASSSVAVSSRETPGLNYAGTQVSSSAHPKQLPAASQKQPLLPSPQHLEPAAQLTSKPQIANTQQHPEYNQAHGPNNFSRTPLPRPPMQQLPGAASMQAPWPRPFAQPPHVPQSLGPTGQLSSTPQFVMPFSQPFQQLPHSQAYQPRETQVHPLSGATYMQGPWHQQPQQPYQQVGPTLHPHVSQYPNIMPPAAFYPFPQPVQPFPFVHPEYMTAQLQHGLFPLPLPAIPMTYTEAGQLPLGYQWYPMPVFGNLPQADQDVDLPEVEISKLLTQDPAT